MLDLVHELPMADTNPDNQPSQSRSLMNPSTTDAHARRRRRLGAGASTPSRAFKRAGQDAGHKGAASRLAALGPVGPTLDCAVAAHGHAARRR